MLDMITYLASYVIMIRTQISLEQVDYEESQKAAQEQGISLAEFVRRAIRNSLPIHKSKPFMAYCGDIESGHPDKGDSIDELVYGRKT